MGKVRRNRLRLSSRIEDGESSREAENRMNTHDLPATIILQTFGIIASYTPRTILASTDDKGLWHSILQVAMFYQRSYITTARFAIAAGLNN